MIHWGSSGAGPRLLYELAAEFAASDGRELIVSYNTGAELGPQFVLLKSRAIPVATYTSKITLLTGLPRLLRTSLTLRRDIRKYGVTTVYSPMFNIWQSISMWIWLPRETVFVATVHDFVSHPGDEHFIKSLSRRIEINRSNGLVTYSKNVGMLVAEAGYNRPIHASVHPAFESRSNPEPRELPKRTITIGFFGRIQEYKGLDLLADAFAQLRANGLDCQLVVYGSGDERLLASFSGRPGVFLQEGWVPESDVNRVVGSFDVLVLPYREASQSGVLALAMGEGVPIVATPVGSLPEQIHSSGAGVVAKAVSVPDIVEALTLLLTDEDLYRSASASGISASRSRYSWRAHQGELSRFFADVRLSGIEVS
ncbi:glycosyltransferase family 4 protein [Gordonia jacobaea]|uniref:glycosyltransferase family 4 protein n=1 Tax=Gordonia jacobaea TaxID=122202 RepID=UPI003D7545AE